MQEQLHVETTQSEADQFPSFPQFPSEHVWRFRQTCPWKAGRLSREMTHVGSTRGWAAPHPAALTLEAALLPLWEPVPPVTGEEDF